MTTNIEMNYSRNQEGTWMIKMDGSHMNVIEKSLIADGMPDEGVNQTLNNAAEILSYCPDPQSENEDKSTGIVIGKVQSGKTSNFIALTALAFDNGYNIITVFGGTKNILVTQNKTRVEQYFQDSNDVLVLDTVDYKDQLKAPVIKQFIKMRRKIVIVALKTPAQINYIRENIFSDVDIKEWPTLIIDDEGDEASLNGLVKKNKKTATYKAIEDLKNTLSKHCFVSVTATPQANMLINALDVLSPDFGVLVNPGKGYCGLDVFHSSEKYTVTIPDDESTLLDEGVPESFVDALAMFFVACGIQKKRSGSYGEKMSMLVHPSHLKNDHDKVFSKVKSIVDEWRDFSSNSEDIAYSDLKELLLRAYSKYADEGVDPLPSFEEIESDIVDAINFTGMHIVNGDHVLNDADKFYDYNIYVGGSMLGRGLTLKGLTITYIIRTPKGKSNVDTTEQRARWFGYKEKYLDLCRIYAIPKIISDFMDIRDHEEDLWNNVQQAHLQGTRFKDVARIFTLSDGLNMTRGNVGAASRFEYSFWNKQRVFQNIPEYISNNITIINAFKQKHTQGIEMKHYGEGAGYTIINVPFDTAYDELLSNFVFPKGSAVNAPMLQRLKSLMNSKELAPDVDVIWMRDGETSKHRIDNGKINNYSVGRRKNYKGDDYQFKKYDTMQLQIHMIQDKDTEVISPALALYVPEQVVERLTNLVIRE